MGQINTREILLVNTLNTAVTTTGQGSDMNMIQGWQAAILCLNVSTVSGTSPTLNVVVQNKLRQPAAADTALDVTGSGTAVYDDFLAFLQMTTTGTRMMRVVTGPLVSSANTTVVTSADYANISNGTLTATDVRIGPIGGIWRVYYTIGGTSPSFQFSLTAQLIPFST